MPRSQGLETEEEEVSDNHLHFLELPVKADDDVRASKALLGVLQQFNEGFFGALAQLLHRHVDVESALPQDGLPRWQLGRVVTGRHAELEALHERFGADLGRAAYVVWIVVTGGGGGQK